jgi:4-hydroxy-2-oxoheptanedioate aldolase
MVCGDNLVVKIATFLSLSLCCKSAASLQQKYSSETMISLRQRLLYHGEKSYGTMLMSDSPVIAELMASVGYSHIVVDHEHSPTDVRSGQVLLQAIAAAGTSTEAIVRLPSPHDPTYMKKVLDSMRLPGGVMLPMVDDAITAKQVIQSLRYSQQDWQVTDYEQKGRRGFAAPFVRATNWGLGSPTTTTTNTSVTKSYMRQCLEDLLVIMQVETPEGIDAIDEIANVDGVDMIFIGPLDLSCSLGKVGQLDDVMVQRLLHHAEQKVKNSGCLLGGFRPPGRSLEEMFGPAGYSLVCGSVDLGLIREAARQDMNDGDDALSR